MSLPTLSAEQNAVVKHVKLGYNVMVDAVAGSGKTTTILNIAKQLPDKIIMLLTYNARLKDETRAKVRKFNIKNLEAHSYHAFCVKYYDPLAHVDTKI